TGRGVRRSIWASGAWRIPGALVPIDEPLAARAREMAELEPDRFAHLGEHAIEVHVPFLHAKNSALKLVPVCLAQQSLNDCRRVAEGLCRAFEQDPPLIVASTDMSHYVPAETAAEL